MLVASGVALWLAAAALAQQPGAANSAPQNNGQNQQEPTVEANQGGEPGESAGMAPLREDPAQLQAAKDRNFLKEVLRRNEMDAELGQLALQKSSSADVKQFAQRIMDQDTQFAQDVTKASRGVRLRADALTVNEKQAITRLQGLSGSAFDRTYILVMLHRAKHSDDAFKIEEGSAQLADVRDMSEQDEPVVASRFESVKQLAASHNVPTSRPQPGASTAANHER
jgi:putative membrane protein